MAYVCKQPECDGTRLGHELYLLEQSDPVVGAAAERLRDAIDRYGHPEDHVIAENLQA